MWRLLRGMIVPASAIAAWEAASASGVMQLEFLSQPSAIVAAGIRGLADGSILLATVQTLEAALFGLAIAIASGVLAGTIIGLSRPIERTVSPTIEALRPIPAVAFIPLTLLLFGFGLPMEGAVVAYACVWPILISTIAAVRGIEPRLLEVGRALGYGALARIWHFALPAALPSIAVGLRVAFGIAIVVTVTVEIAANPRGLGYAMITAQQSLRAEVMYAYLFWIGIVGWLINFAMTRTERRLLRWYWSARAAS
jgi:ABC-type nitrate/sulfonate/bicarbonate transport system permease component